MPIAILCTYAPHQGRIKKEQKEHWVKTQEIIKKNIPKKRMILRRADTNGQIETLESEEQNRKNNCAIRKTKQQMENEMVTP